MIYRFIFLFTICLGICCFTGCQQSEVTSPVESSEQRELPEYDLLLKQERQRGCYSPALTVMTRNVYVGTDVDKVLAATNPQQIPFLVAEAFEMLNATNFYERAQSLAREIFITRPQLIGLQEISLVRVQPDGDFLIGGTISAEEEYIDFLTVLLNALKRRGLDYQVAGKVENADVELPMVPGLQDNPTSDVRLTDYDVVLARHDVDILDVTSANFQIGLPVPGIGTIPRGYVAVDVSWKSNSFKFVNTHLEPVPDPEDPYFPVILEIQQAQAQELIATFGDLDEPVIMVGDFNSPAPDGDTYNDFTAAGFIDIWTQNLCFFNPDGYTYGHDLDLRNAYADFYERIDFIFVKTEDAENDIGPVFAIVVGDEYWNKTRSGLWPSDHGGVVARLRLYDKESLLTIH